MVAARCAGRTWRPLLLVRGRHAEYWVVLSLVAVMIRRGATRIRREGSREGEVGREWGNNLLLLESLEM